MKLEYKFIRYDVTNEDNVTEFLNTYAKEGWTIISHCENDGEYSFVLKRGSN